MSLNNFSETEREIIVNQVFSNRVMVFNLLFERGNDSFKGLKKFEIKKILSILKANRNLAYGLSGNKNDLVVKLISVGFVRPPRRILDNTPTPTPTPIPTPPPPSPSQAFGNQLELFSKDEINAPDLGITVELAILDEKY
ncbi:hypothetical protein RB653_010425 [Dictyostelium firmibasis]|uniref:Uncharacterized protein n=1 Tax=Dictyostelium firmibasis TaxID=79012 RepID=A0AAN7TLW2_9MYCE